VAPVLLGGCLKKSADKSAAVNDGKANQNQTQNQEQDQAQANDQEAGITNPSGSYSINELFNMKRPMKCTWKESVTGDSDVSNLIYLSGKKFYQDVTMGDIGHGFSIFDGEYLYIWNDFNEMASKMKNTEATTASKPGQGNAGMDQKKDFVCESWVADNSVFIPPANKNFKDMTEEMGQAMGEMGQNADKYKEQACEMCLKAPTQELRDECLANAQCE
jgi:hypothetical protein